MLLKPAKDSVDVLIFVNDIRKCLDFYQRTLGLEKTEEVEALSVMPASPQQIFELFHSIW